MSQFFRLFFFSGCNLHYPHGISDDIGGTLLALWTLRHGYFAFPP